MGNENESERTMHAFRVERNVTRGSVAAVIAETWQEAERLAIGDAFTLSEETEEKIEYNAFEIFPKGDAYATWPSDEKCETFRFHVVEPALLAVQPIAVSERALCASRPNLRAWLVAFQEREERLKEKVAEARELRAKARRHSQCPNCGRG